MLLGLFRSKLAEEVGGDGDVFDPGYDGLMKMIRVLNEKYPSKRRTQEASRCVESASVFVARHELEGLPFDLDLHSAQAASAPSFFILFFISHTSQIVRRLRGESDHECITTMAASPESQMSPHCDFKDFALSMPTAQTLSSDAVFRSTAGEC